MASARGDIYDVTAFLDGITLIYLEASSHFFRRIVETYRLRQPKPSSVRKSALWVPAEDIDGIWPFLSICDLRHLPTASVLLRKEYRATRKPDLLDFWQQIEELVSIHRSLQAQLQYRLASTLSYDLWFFTGTSYQRPEVTHDDGFWVGSRLPPSPFFREALFTAQKQRGTMVLMLDFFGSWVHTVQRPRGPPAALDEEAKDVVQLDALCPLDGTVKLRCALDDPACTVVPTTSPIHDRVTKGEPIPFLFNLSIPDTPRPASSMQLVTLPKTC